MPPSADSNTCTASDCLTRSTPKKRNLRSSKPLVEADIRKKPRGSSSLSETSPRRSDNVDRMGQLTQDSEPKRSSPDNEAYVHLDLPSRRPQQEYFPSTQIDDGFLKRAPFRNEERLPSEDVNGSVRSMILHLRSFTRSILIAYEKERNWENRGSSAFMSELAQQRTFNETVASELTRLRTFHEAATFELSQLRISNEAAATEVANLQLELVKKEAAASSQLDEFHRQQAMRDAVNILAAFIMSKALLMKEQAELCEAGSSEIDNLRFEKAQVTMQGTRDVEDRSRLQNLQLQSSLAAAEAELTKHSCEIAELTKGNDEREERTSLATHDLLCRLEAMKEEVKQVCLNTEALLREKDEAAAKSGKAVALKVQQIESLNEVLLRGMKAAREIADAEIDSMKSTLEGTTDSLKKVISEKEEMAREKFETESRAKLEITQLQSDIAALVAERETMRRSASREFERLSSTLENARENLESERHTTGLEKAKLQSDITAKNSELAQLKRKLLEVQAYSASREAQRAADVARSGREKEEGHAREAALLDKLQASTVVPRLNAEMHLAFLINCGLIRPEDSSLNLMTHHSLRRSLLP